MRENIKPEALANLDSFLGKFRNAYVKTFLAGKNHLRII